MGNLISTKERGQAQHKCPTFFCVRQERQDLHCAEFNERALQQMDAVPSDVPVIIANRSSAYLYGNRYGGHDLNPIIFFDSTLRKLDKRENPFLQEYSDLLVASTCRIAKTRPVYLRRPLPEMPVDVPRTMARAAHLGRSFQENMPLATYQQRNAVVWAAQDRAAKQCKVELLDPLPALCEYGACVAHDRTNPLFYDENHLTEYSNQKLIHILSVRENHQNKFKSC